MSVRDSLMYRIDGRAGKQALGTWEPAVRSSVKHIRSPIFYNWNGTGRVGADEAVGFPSYCRNRDEKDGWP